MCKFPKFPSSTWTICRKHDEKWSLLGFMCLMYTLREVIPHNSGTCRKLLGGFKVSPPPLPKKNMHSLIILYIIRGYKPHLCSFVVLPQLFWAITFRPPFVAAEPTQLHFRPALKGFWVTAPWLSMAELCPKKEIFSSPPRRDECQYMFLIWMIVFL